MEWQYILNPMFMRLSLSLYTSTSETSACGTAVVHGRLDGVYVGVKKESEFTICKWWSTKIYLVPIVKNKSVGTKK